MRCCRNKFSCCIRSLSFLVMDGFVPSPTPPMTATNGWKVSLGPIYIPRVLSLPPESVLSLSFCPRSIFTHQGLPAGNVCTGVTSTLSGTENVFLSLITFLIESWSLLTSKEISCEFDPPWAIQEGRNSSGNI